MVAQLWADVKYHVPTGIDFSPKVSGFCFSASQYLSTEPRREFPGLFVRFGDEAAAVVVTEGDNVHFKQRLESATPQHQRRPRWGGQWHRQKDKNRTPSRKTKPGRDVILHVRP